MNTMNVSKRMSFTIELFARFSGSLVRSLREHCGPLIIVLLIAAGGNWTANSLNTTITQAIGLYLPTYFRLLLSAILLLLAGRLVWTIFELRPKRPISIFIRQIRERFVTVERITLAFPILLVMPVFAGTFTLLKSVIAIINPFSWDPIFADWDSRVHFGYPPWVLLQPILGHPVITWTINLFYNLWFVVLSIFWCWQAFTLHDRHLRLQFFYTLFLTWPLLGFIAAVYFSSAGPCYFAYVTDGADPFSPLMLYLQRANESYPIWALQIQQTLWTYHETRTVQLGAGISAMPSLHVAMAFLFMLVAWRTARWLGLLFFIYFFLILIGSVHLAWHYAIDGYIAVLALLPIWWLSGKLAALVHEPPGARQK